MDLMGFLSKLANVVSRDEVTSELVAMEKEIQEYLIPEYTKAAKFFDGKFKAKLTKELNTKFQRNSKNKDFMLDMVSSRLPTLLTNVQTLLKLTPRLVGKTLLKNGLTTKSATVVRSIEQLNFVTLYALEVLSYCYVREMEVNGSDNHDIVKLLPAKVEMIEVNIANFALLLDHYTSPKFNIEQQLASMVDVVASQDNYEALLATYSISKIDPTPNIPIQGFDGWIFYELGKQWVEWEAKRYKLNVDKHRKLELQLAYLKNLQSQSNNPSLEKEILYLENRIDKLEYSIRQAEESVGGI